MGSGLASTKGPGLPEALKTGAAEPVSVGAIRDRGFLVRVMLLHLLPLGL